MKTLIVFNHPYEGSYCNAILEAVQSGLKKGNHPIDLIHLEKDNFDPIMRGKDLLAFVKARNDVESAYALLDPQVMDYKNRMEKAEHLVFIFPIWWELMPALTKGFIDKLIFPGIAYDNGKSIKMNFRLKNLKGITVITTMNTPSFVYRLLFGNAIKNALLRGTFWKIGCPNRKWISLNMVKSASEEKRKKWLAKIERRFAKLK
jgi:putative NADPH-quinone reductase